VERPSLSELQVLLRRYAIRHPSTGDIAGLSARARHHTCKSRSLLVLRFRFRRIGRRLRQTPGGPIGDRRLPILRPGQLDGPLSQASDEGLNTNP
jgi:hypothetical protein